MKGHAIDTYGGTFIWTKICLEFINNHLKKKKKDIFCLLSFWGALIAQLVELEPHAERSCPVILNLSHQYNPNETKLMTYNNWLARRGRLHWFQKQSNCMSAYEQSTHLPLKLFPSVNNFSLSLWSQSPLVVVFVNTASFSSCKLRFHWEHSLQ